MAKILIIDDEKDVCREFRDVLEEENHEVDTATSGKTALSMIQTMPYDIVFLDMIMPGMEGLKTFEQIRKVSQIPVVAISGYLIPTKEKKMLDLGVMACLHKPLDLAAVKNLIRSAESKKRSRAAVSA
jgi:DNA-binding response OmpR family regulator